MFPTVMKYINTTSNYGLMHFLMYMDKKKDMRIREIIEVIAREVEREVRKIKHVNHIRGKDYNFLTMEKLVDLCQISLISWKQNYNLRSE